MPAMSEPATTATIDSPAPTTTTVVTSSSTSSTAPTSTPKVDHRTCPDFKYQEDAQAAFVAGNLSLDGDGNGVACQTLPHRPVHHTTPAPATTTTHVAVPIDNTSTAALANTGASATVPLILGVALVLGGVAAVLTARRRRTATPEEHS